MKKTKIITFPRSGHTLLTQGLMWVFQDEIVYCEPYKSKHTMDVCQWTNVQKSHDFDLTDEIDPNMNYIVQIRGFELAVESWYKMAVAEGLTQTFDEFRQSKSDYFDGFMAKWVSSQMPNRLVVTYNDLVSDKVNTMVRVFRHITDRPLERVQYEAMLKWEQANKDKSLIRNESGKSLSLFYEAD